MQRQEPVQRRPLAGAAIAAAVAALSLLPGSIAIARAEVELRSPLAESNVVQRQLREVVGRSARSVVAVTAFATTPADATLWQGRLDGSTFAELAARYPRSCGSAFAIDASGHLLTSEHVVSGAASVWVTDDAGAAWPAIVLGTDPRTDLAVLKIPTSTVPLDVGDGRPTRGDMVVTLGNPSGISTDGEMSASVGCVSAARRSLPTLSAKEGRTYTDLIQITTPIGTGSSGGPLIDLDGRAVGLVCATVPGELVDQPIGFAIPLSAEVLARVQQLKRGEEIIYGYVGVMVSTANVTVAAADDRTRLAGVRVDRVDAGTPAEGVLRPGDVIVSMGGEPIASDLEFIRKIGLCPVDREVPLTVRREDATIELQIRPRRRQLPLPAVTTATRRLDWAGVTFGNRAEGEGVTVVSVSPDAQMPLEAGAVIRKVNDEVVNDVAHLLDVLHRHGGASLELDVTVVERE